MKSDWINCMLGDLITFQRGYDLPKTKINSGEFPVVGSNGIIGWHNEYTTEAPSITIGRSGNVGKPFLMKGRSWSHNTTLYIKEFKNVDPIFIFYLLKTLGLGNYAGGSAVPTLNRNHIHTMPVTVPKTIEEQTKIAKMLSVIDEKIELNVKINDNLTEQARSIFQSWFIDYEPFYGNVPSDWHPSTLGQIAVVKTDSWSPAKNPDIMVEHYSIPAFDEQHYPVFETASGVKSNKYILTSDSVMISKLNPDIKRIWRPMCLSAHPVCSTEFIVYEARKKGHKDFIYSILDSVPFLNYLCSHTTGSTNSRQRATPKTTLDFPVLLPPESVIKEFCDIVTPMYDLIASNIIENQSLAKTRDSILPKLMSGELDVSLIIL